MGSCMSKQNNNQDDTDNMDDTYYNVHQDDRTNDELSPQELRDREARQMIECMNRRGNAF